MILPWNQYKYDRFESREFSTIDSNYPLSCPLSFKGIAKHLSTHCCAGNFCSSWDKMNRVLRNWQAPNVTSTIGMVQWRNIGSGCALLTPILCPSGLFGAPSWALAKNIFFDDLFCFLCSSFDASGMFCTPENSFPSTDPAFYTLSLQHASRFPSMYPLSMIWRTEWSNWNANMVAAAAFQLFAKLG